MTELEEIKQMLIEMKKNIEEIKESINKMEKSCDNMDNHITFIDGVYDTVKTPFQKVLNICNQLTFNDNTILLENKK